MLTRSVASLGSHELDQTRDQCLTLKKNFRSWPPAHTKCSDSLRLDQTKNKIIAAHTMMYSIASPVIAQNVQLSPSTPQSEKRGHSRDFFYSHNWGEDELGRNNHLRVENLARYMNTLSFTCWFDSFELQAGGGAYQGGFRQSICQGIDDSTIFVVCLTRKYIRKVREGPTLARIIVNSNSTMPPTGSHPSLVWWPS